MIIKSTSEIYRNAQMLGQVFNSDFDTFEFATDSLNTIYRNLYDSIAQSNQDYFVDKQLVEKNDTPLNEDIYNIKSVRFTNDNGSFTEIERCPSHTFVSNTYSLEDDIFHYNGNINRPIEIRYNPVPKTLTMPFTSEEMDIEADSFGEMYSDGIYYKKDNKEYFYDFSTKESSTAENYKDHEDQYTIDIEKQTVFNGEEDISSVFTDLGTFNAIYSDEDYTIVSYSNGDIYLFCGLVPCKYNLNVSSGHSTKGEVFGIRTDDKTGYGIVYWDKRDNKYYYAPFVPDTVLNYPNNTLFYLMEVRLAIQMAVVNNLPADYLKAEDTKATESFFRELRKDKSPQRINNVYSKRCWSSR